LFGFSKYCHILGKTLCSGPRRQPGQASPWKHRPSSSAPCAVLMRLSRIGQHIKDHVKDEPCAEQRALLGVFSSRSSSISRGMRSAGSIFSSSPLVHVGTAVPLNLEVFGATGTTAVLKVNRSKSSTQIGHLEKRLRNGRRNAK
jgi:hypothetical protein